MLKLNRGGIIYIVQTKWMKKACIEKANVDGEKIHVVPPVINSSINEFFRPNEACKRLKNENMRGLKIIFTLRGDENNHIANLYKEVQAKHLPIEFVGSLTREQVFDLYTKAILLFPSYIETFGLPMLEARLHKGMILASDCPFSHEILDGYKNAYFFDAFSENELAKLIELCISKEIEYKKVENVTSSRIAREPLITYIV